MARVLRRSGGRVVIVGLTVDLPASLRYPLSFVPSSWDHFYAIFEPRAADAGLAAHLTWRDDPPARLPIVILEPQDQV
jgi:hypothetical protein